MAKRPLKATAPRKEPAKRKAVAKVEVIPERAYHTSFPKVVRNLAFRGDTDADICGVLGVGSSTFYRWLNLHPDLRENLDAGRAESGEAADGAVERALYERAVGYELEEEQAKFVPEKDDKGKATGEYKLLRAKVVKVIVPDVGAAEMWLTNRKPHKWRKRVENTVNLNLTVRRALLELPDE